MKIINLTPHVLVCAGISIPSAGVARAAEISVQIDEVETEAGKIPVFKTRFGEPFNLPAPQAGTGYVVSSLTAAAVKQFFPNRKDIYVPGKQIRDDAGRVVGCEGLAIY